MRLDLMKWELVELYGLLDKMGENCFFVSGDGWTGYGSIIGDVGTDWLVGVEASGIISKMNDVLVGHGYKKTETYPVLLWQWFDIYSWLV